MRGLPRVFVLAVTVAACQPSKLDTGAGSDSVPSEAPVALPALPECPGADYVSDTHPMPYPGNPWWYIRTSISDVLDVWSEATHASVSTGCPTLSNTDDAETLSGNCTADGVDFSGTWTFSGGDTQLQDVVASLSGEDASIQFEGEGRFRWLHEGDHYSVEADGSYSKASGGELDGAFAFSGLVVEHDSSIFQARGSVDIEWHYGLGRYCPIVDFTASPSCASEPDGYWALQGMDTWVIVADGSNRCDDCVEIFLNGEWQETFCDVYGDFL